MKKVFIGGSRRISRLNEQLRKRLDQIIQKRLPVLLGDANGADKAVQSYLAECGYQNVQVFCSAGDCRNNLGPWEVKSVKPPHQRRDFEFFTAKDAAMAEEADVGFMLWDGESSGTVVNAARLIAAGKPVVVYIAPDKEFRTLKSQLDLEALLSPCSSEIRQRIDRYVADHAHAQPAMF
jgi:adenine-specific DNA-methyltransferase